MLVSIDNFEELIDNLPIGIIRNDTTQKNSNQFNYYFQKMFGWEETDIDTMDKWFLSAYPDETYRKEVISKWVELVEYSEKHGYNNSYQQQTKVRCKDGSSKWCEWKYFKHEQYVYGICTDISELKQYAITIEHKEKEYRQLVEGLGNKFIIYKHDVHTGKFLFLTKGFEAVFNMPVSEALNTDWRELVEWDEGEVEYADQQDKKLINGEIDFSQYELRYKRQDGKEGNLFLSGFMLEDENEKDRHIFHGIAEDVTEIRALENERESLLKELERVNAELKILNTDLAKQVDEEVTKRMKVEEEKLLHEQFLAQKYKMVEMGEMMGAIIHQWKQPLNTLSLDASIINKQLQKHQLEIPELSQTTENIKNQVSFMSYTMNSFRNFFNQNVPNHNFYPHQTIERMKDMFKGIFEKNNIEIIINVDNAFSVCANESEFMQVILNIFNNAKEAMDIREYDGGTITCCIDSSKIAGYISIKDTSGGIPEELLPEQIFEAHFSTKSKKNSGIGLYICRNIINKMNGSLTAQNWEKGAQFDMEIKLEDKS